MFTHERFNLIKKLVRQHRRMDFSQLEELVQVSPATLRRDLTALEKSGDIIRVHGGVLDPAYLRTEVPFEERVVRHRGAKKAIAAAAAALVPSGATVIIDAGSTCLEAARALLNRGDVRLVTNSVALLEAAYRGEAPVVCIGGELRKVSGALTGGAALGALDTIHADVALIGASGLDAQNGCSTTELSEAEIKRALLNRAQRRILLADHSKWDKPSSIRFANWTDLTDWVTDRPPENPPKLKIHQAGE